MIDHFFSKLPLTTLIILFLFCCGGLYLVGYWTTFDSELLALVEIMEIPKSFILPFAIGMGVLMVEIVVLCFFWDTKTRSNTVTNIITAASDSLLDILITASLALGFLLSYIFPKSILYWNVSIMIYCTLITFRLSRFPSIRNYIWNSRIYTAIFFFLLVLPAISFALGKTQALYIYNNKKIKRINQASIIASSNKSLTTDSLELKLLGFLGDKFIISTLDNKKIFILEKSGVDGVEFYTPKKEK